MRSLRTQVRPLVRLGPAENDHRHACRVAAGLFVPGLALLVAGRPDLIIYAVFGSFAGMYGRAESDRLRIVHQAQAGAVLVSGVGAGVLLASAHAAPWVLVATEVGCASAWSLLSDRLGLRPAGPFFGIFALGATATVPAGRVAPWAAVSICAATVLFCLLVSCASALRSRERSGRREVERGPGALVHAARYAVAVSAAGAGGLLLGVEHANWAMASAAVPLAAIGIRHRTAPGIHGVVHRGIHRVLGTFAGLAVTAALLLPQLPDTALAVIVVALLFPTELFMARHYGLALGFFTPLIMLMTALAAPAEPLALLRDRAIDTLIGVAAGIAAAIVIRRRAAADLRRR
ncbi:FUSC family protein [Saccharopolyspora hirsuta]|uniref:FUSC family protein n=1 Tax=Saccharopolyspora hirsuta TaxID=1837 RepID=A0A5M7BU05_SACHI|nr:FUSC family protein [Saccharopolyspora hirsuta]KAA5830691.1 FUSC family protein [Saccharopolyspora hirsuta]